MSPMIQQYVGPYGLYYFVVGALVFLGILVLLRYNRLSSHRIPRQVTANTEPSANIPRSKPISELAPATVRAYVKGAGSRPSALQLHLKSLYEDLPRPTYVDHGDALPTSPPPPWFQWNQVRIKLLQEAQIWGSTNLNEVEGSKTQQESRRKAQEIAEAYVGLHWKWQEYGAPWQVTEDKINRWVKEILSRGIIREVTTPQGRKRAEGLDDIQIYGQAYLADLRAFHNEMTTRKAFWRQKLLGTKIVLSSDPIAKSLKAVTFEELPQGIEDCWIGAHGTPRVPDDYQFRPHRVVMRLDEQDVVVQVEIG